MKLKKNLLISFLLAIGYCCLSLYYFLGGLDSVFSESTFWSGIESAILLPGVLVFGAAYGGDDHFYFTVFIIFLVIWLVAFVLILLISRLIKVLKSMTHK